MLGHQGLILETSLAKTLRFSFSAKAYRSQSYSFSVIGETQLQLQVNGTIIPTRISFVVVDDCVTNVILGQPFITEHVKLIKGHDGSLVLNTNDTASSTSSQEVSTGSSDNSAAAQQRIQEEVAHQYLFTRS